MTDQQPAFPFQFLIHAPKEEFARRARLLDVIQQETQTLCDSGLTEAIDIGIRKGDAFRQSEAAIRRRVDAVTKCIASLRFEDALPFGGLAPCTDAATRQILTDYRDKSADIARRIKSANETNRRIIALTLAQVVDTIHVITDTPASLPKYDRRVRIRARSLQGELLSQAG